MYQRISVVGTAGVGKTTFARALADRLNVSHIELDELHWGPGWQPAAAEEFRALVRERIRERAWIADGNYQSILGRLVWEHADAVVWLDPPRWVTIWRLVRRTAVRVIARKRLWNGNREGATALMFWRREESILWWSWTTYERNKERYQFAMADPECAGLRFHRLRTKSDVAGFLAKLPS